MIFQIIPILFSIFSVSKAWKYEIQTFSNNYSQSNDQYSEVEYFEEFYDYVEKFIYLENGKTLNCRIPLHEDSLPDLSSLYIDKPKKEETKNYYLSEEQALKLMSPLNDICSYNFKHDFLYEFCFQKYVKQFDDEQTVRNVRKTAYEIIFLGYNNEQVFNNATNTTQYMNEKPVYKVTNLIHEKPQLYMEKNIAYFHKYTGQKDSNCKIVLKDQGNKEIPILRGLDINTAIIQNQQQYNSQQSIENFEVRCNQISTYSDQDVFIASHYYIFDDVIFGKKLNAFLKFKQQDQILIVLENGEMQLAQINKIYTENLIQISHNFNQNIQATQLILINSSSDQKIDQQKQEQWVILEKEDIVISDNYLINVNENIQKGNLIKIITDHETSTDFKIKNIFHQIAKLSGHTGDFKGIYVAKISTSIKKDLNINNNNNNNNSNNNNGFGLHRKYGLSQLSFNNKEDIAKYTQDQYLSNEVFNFSQFGGRVLISFELQKIKKNQASSLRIFFSETENESINGIEILLPFNQEIMIRETSDLDSFSKKNPFFQNFTDIHSSKIWILLLKNQIFLGHGTQIEGASIIASHEIQNQLNLNHFKINTHKTYNIKLKHFKVSGIDRSLLDTIEFYQGSFIKNSIFNKKTQDGEIQQQQQQQQQQQIVNGEVIDIFQNLNLNKNDKLHYREFYHQGEYCDPIKANRTVIVNYECGDSIFKIKNVSEKKTCEYTLDVQTKFLCNPDREIEETLDEQNQKFEKVHKIQCIPI